MTRNAGKCTQSKHNFILQKNQLHVSADDGSHRRADHKYFKKEMSTAALVVRISNLTNAVLYNILSVFI